MKTKNTVRKQRLTNTGVKQVYFRPERNRFETYFQAYNSDKKHIGTFVTLEEAIKARNNFINSLK